MPPFRCRRIDDRKKAPWQFCVGGCSLFVERRLANAMRTIQVLFPIASPVQSQYCRVKRGVLAFFAFAAEPRPGTASRRALETACLNTWHTPNVPSLIPSECLSIARKKERRFGVNGSEVPLQASALAWSIRSPSKPPAAGTRFPVSPDRRQLTLLLEQQSLVPLQIFRACHWLPIMNTSALVGSLSSSSLWRIRLLALLSLSHCIKGAHRCSMFFFCSVDRDPAFFMLRR